MEWSILVDIFQDYFCGFGLILTVLIVSVGICLYLLIFKRKEIAMARRLNIKRAVKHPGALRRAAQRAGAITKKGTIKKAWINQQAKKGGKIGARARFARTLARIRHKR
jgi:cytochrome c biogenesis protein ResB